MKIHHSLRSALLTGAFLAPSFAHAAVLSSESFSGYTAGQIQANPSPAVPGYTGNWTGVDFGNAKPSIKTGSLVYGNPLYVGSSGDRVGVDTSTAGGETDVNNSGRVYRLLDSSLTVTAATTGSLYMSFLFQSGQETGATIYQTLALYNTNTADANRTFDVGLTTNGGQTGTSYNFGAQGAYSSLGVAADTNVHLFVVRFDLSAAAGGDSLTVWLDPNLSGGEPAGGTTVSGLNLAWDRLALSDYDGNSAAWDEIRFGTDFNSVVVPEPSTSLLGVIGMMALLRRRRA